MTATRKTRVSTAGGKAIACRVGAASSAAKMHGRSGFAEYGPTTFVYIRSEGFVRWTEICRQFDQAFREFAMKRAMNGVYVTQERK